jgi:DNA-binding NarL/FixJ family response regulator
MTLRRTQILIADDHKTARLRVAALLSHRLDWEVCGLAADGQEAVDLAKKSLPDLAVLDVQMPRLNGIEVAKAILRYCPHAIIVSNHEVNLFAGQLRELGVDGFVDKLHLGTDLVSAVEAVLSGETSFLRPISRNF